MSSKRVDTKGGPGPGAVAVAVKEDRGKQAASATKKNAKSRPRLSRSFFKTLASVLKDGFGRREWVDLGCLTGSLLARSLMSLWVAQNMGVTIEHFCNRKWKEVFRNIAKFGVVTTLAALLNALLKLYTGFLGLHVRDRLTAKAHTLLMERMNYYRANWVGTDKFENCDQLIADDIEKFSSALAEVYSQSLKPIVDFVIFSVQLGSTLGVAGPLGMHTWFAVAAAFSAGIMPAFGKLAAKEQQLEGRFRARHAALIKNSESEFKFQVQGLAVVVVAVGGEGTVKVVAVMLLVVLLMAVMIR